MRIHFWGVRGSIPAPLSPNQIKDKISAVVQRISPADLRSADTREMFLASLPDWIFGTTGGNTSCVEVENASGDCIILDAGSGLLAFSMNALKRPGMADRPKTYHILLSHFHWDHIQGIPFFSQLYKKENRVVFYSTSEKCREILENQMRPPCFPPDAFPGDNPNGASVEFVTLPPGNGAFSIGSSEITYRGVRHPGGCTAYRITEGGKSLIYCTDIEIDEDSFVKTEENTSFFDSPDMLILDSQYDTGEFMRKKGWGHSSFSNAVNFAVFWNAGKLFLFHYEPSYSDKKIHDARQDSEYRMEKGSGNMPVILAKEDMDCFL